MKKCVALMTIAGLTLATLALSGCAENERRTVTVRETQERGEVQDVDQGEMVVE